MADRADNSQEIARLLELSAASRSRLGLELAVLRHRLDAPAKVLSSVRAHPLRWLGGSLAAGLSVAWLLRRKPAPPVRPARRAGGWLWSLALSAATPVLKAWVAGQLQTFLADRLAQPPKTVQHPPASAPDGLRRPAPSR